MKKIIFILSFLVLLLVPLTVLASSTDVVRNESTGTGYASLSEAVNAASAGDTLTLLANIQLDGQVVIRKNLTLDLGAYTITDSPNFASNNTTLLNSTAEITLRATTGGIIANRRKCYAVSVSGNTASINIESGTYQANYVPILVSNTTAFISGGEIKSETTDAVWTVNSTVTFNGDVSIVASEDTCVYSWGSNINLSGNANLTGKTGITLVTEDSIPSSLNMTGGSIDTLQFSVVTNGNISHGCSASITGNASIHSGSSSAAIYWPAQCELTIGGNATVTGGTGIDVRRGVVTIQDSAVITAIGNYSQTTIIAGASKNDGSALQIGSQFYDGSLTVNLNGGTLKSEKGNAISVVNTQNNSQPTQLTLTGTNLQAAHLPIEFFVPAEPDTVFSSGSLQASSDQTILNIPTGNSDVVAARILTSGDKQLLAFYSSVDSAFNAATGGTLYLLADTQLPLLSLTDPDLTVITAPGINMTVTSSNPSYAVRAERNPDGSTTYYLVAPTPGPNPDTPSGSLDSDPYSYYEPLPTPTTGAHALPQTSDHTPLTLYLMLSFACACVFVVFLRKRRA